MRPRYLLALSSDGQLDPRITERCKALAPGLASHRLAGDPGKWLILAPPRSTQSLCGGGLLIGSLFARGASGRVTLSEAEGKRAIASAGASIVRTFWGSYVLILADRAIPRVEIVRAPFGDLPCYWAQCGSTLLVASDLGLLEAAGMKRPPIEPEALARHLAAEDLRRPETCLSGVNELPGGTRMSWPGGLKAHQILWSPWDHVHPLGEPGDEERRLQSAVLHCVGARTSETRRVLLKLSGGLDSSIVAAALRSSGHSFTALNLVTRDPAGDERHHARVVAKALGIELVERFREASHVSVGWSAAARLPRPTSQSFLQESARLAAEVASASGCDAVFDGGAGDNLFCSMQSVRPLVDSLRSDSGRHCFWPAARTIAELNQASLPAVLARTLRVSVRRSARYPWPTDLSWLSKHSAAMAREGMDDHPWLEPPPGALPGKAAHVALVAGAQSVAEGFDAEQPLPACSPLISQPVVEACLRIPTWRWFDGGCNRAVARAAFRGLLPDATLDRRSKAGPDCFVAELYRKNRPAIRELLLDGVLVGLGLLDTDALREELGSDGLLEGHYYLRIMRLADVEAWARCWS